MPSAYRLNLPPEQPMKPVRHPHTSIPTAGSQQVVHMHTSVDGDVGSAETEP
jgi:hypothetical protein